MSGIRMLDQVFGVHADALKLKARRVTLLSSNIANADTPGFKAKDLDFKKVLEIQGGFGAMRTTHSEHLSTPFGDDSGEVFRVPFNPSVDGNTVEIGLEQARFGKATADYQATLDFLQTRVAGIKRALKGE